MYERKEGRIVVRSKDDCTESSSRNMRVVGEKKATTAVVSSEIHFLKGNKR